MRPITRLLWLTDPRGTGASPVHLEWTWARRPCHSCCRGTVIVRALIAMLALAAAAGAADQQSSPAPVTQPIRFESVDVLVDSGNHSLAAYQFELKTTRGDATIVGIEGGDHAAYREPPFYDPAALTRSRVIIAAFSTQDELPAGKTRVARVHLRVAGPQRTEYAAKLVVAAEKQGNSIPANIVLVQGETK